MTHKFTAYADTLSKPADSGRVRDVEKVLAALGHVRVPNTRCLARVAEIPKELAPPGPHNPPIWCCLPEGHDGKHRHNSGGMYPSIAFRDTDEVVMGDPLPDYCEKCRRIWPCDEAAAVTAALAAQGQVVSPAGKVIRTENGSCYIEWAAQAVDVHAEAYAERLARALWRKHYADDAPQWEPLTGDLFGMLSQIDNMTTDLTRAIGNAQAEE